MIVLLPVFSSLRADPARLAQNAFLDADNPDLTAFRDHGGKILWYHGTVVPSTPYTEILRYYENMKIHEIARHLGISKGTVKSRLHYAIGQMHKLLPDELNLFGACGTEEIRQ